MDLGSAEDKADQMICKRCGSENVRELPSEIAIHFPGPEGYKHPHVFAFPMLLICTICGFTEFVLAARELRQLHEEFTRPKGTPHHEQPH